MQLFLFKILAQVELGDKPLHIPTTEANDKAVADALSIIFAGLGATALLVMVLAGFRYSLSRGDPEKVKKSRNTIIYALVGLILSLLAFTIVRYTVRSLG